MPRFPETIERVLEAQPMNALRPMIKIHPAVHRYPVDGPNYRPLWEYAQRTAAVVLSHTWESDPNFGPRMFIGIARQYPAARIILGHSGVTRKGYEEAIEAARGNENLFLDTAGSQSHDGIVERLKIIAVSLFVSKGLGMSLNSAILLTGVIIIIYTALGGLWAVCISDFVQFILMATAVVLLLPLSLRQAGGISGVLSRMPDGFLSPFHAPYTPALLENARRCLLRSAASHKGGNAFLRRTLANSPHL